MHFVSNAHGDDLSDRNDTTEMFLQYGGNTKMFQIKAIIGIISIIAAWTLKLEKREITGGGAGVLQ